MKIYLSLNTNKKTLIILCTGAMVLLICAVPFMFNHFLPEKDSSDNNTPSFETVDTPDKTIVYRTSSDTIESINFEDYIIGVVSCEMPSTFHEEALKAQAVAARTYSTAKIMKSITSGNPDAHPQAPLCDTTHCQVYKSINEIEEIKGKTWMKNDWEKICNAVNSTEDQLLYYQGNLVEQALFHSSSGGMTENSEAVFSSALPYLVSVESPYENEATHQNEKVELSIDQLISKLNNCYPTISLGYITPENIKILGRSESDRVEKMQIGSAEFTGREIREALGLYSTNFDIKTQDNTITFTSKGSGHGVGMSQYGADGMAKEGFDYKKILSHYYSGTTVY